MKDNFSADAKTYATFRPSYPQPLYRTLLELVEGRSWAWDCATGNGQVAAALAEYFANVTATDVSEEQLRHAVGKKNVTYLREEAERSSAPDARFDLVTVAQALHWFETVKFFREADRTLRPGGVLAVFGYTLCRVGAPVDRVIDRLYYDVLDGYWDEERKLVDSGYAEIAFPYPLIATPVFSMSYEWTLDHLLGFLGSWSAVRHFKNRLGKTPIDEVAEELRTSWGRDGTRTVTFPIFLKAGRKGSS